MGIKYWKGGMAGAEGDWGETLTSKTLDNAAAVDLGGTPNRVRIPSTAHTFIEKDYVVMDGTTNYEGEFRLVNVDSADTFDIEATYVAETFAGTETLKGSNWQDKDGVPVALPAAADTVIFDGSASEVVGKYSRHREGNHWNCLDSIGRADTGELELTDLFIEIDYTGNIGIDSENTISELHISIADNGGIYFRSNGKAFIKCSADDATTSINIPLLVHDSSSGCLSISSDMNDATYTSYWDIIKCLDGGQLQIENDTPVGEVYTFRSTITIFVGTGCVEVADSDDPIDLYVNNTTTETDFCSAGSVVPVAQVDCQGPINFGSSALTLTKTL